MDNEEHELGVRCVAVPVVNHENQVLYGISVTGPISRMSDQRVEELIPRVQAAANEISNYLGYSR